MALEITPEIQEAIDKAVEAATEGLKANNQKLIRRSGPAGQRLVASMLTFAALEAERDELKGQVAKLNKKTLKKATDDLGIGKRNRLKPRRISHRICSLTTACLLS